MLNIFLRVGAMCKVFMRSCVCPGIVFVALLWCSYGIAIAVDNLPLQESEIYIPDINSDGLDGLTKLPNVSAREISSCKDMIVMVPPMPNDPDVNLIYVNVYTWCMMQAVLKVFLDANNKNTADSPGKQEILQALSTLSSFLPALLLAYHHAIPAFSGGLRNDLSREQAKIQREFPEPKAIPFSGKQ